MNDALYAEAWRRRISVSEIVRENVEAEVSSRRSRLPGFVGLADKTLPYTAENAAEELAKTFGLDSFGR